MIEHGVNVLDAAADGQTPLTMAMKSGSYQVVVMVIDRLKALAAPPPDEALRKRLQDTFGKSHFDAKNRLQQTLKDWDRIAKQQRPPGELSAGLTRPSGWLTARRYRGPAGAGPWFPLRSHDQTGPARSCSAPA